MVFVLWDVEDHWGVGDDELPIGDVAQHHSVEIFDSDVAKDALGDEEVVYAEEMGFNQFLLLFIFVEVVFPLYLVIVPVGFHVVFDGVFQEVVALFDVLLCRPASGALSGDKGEQKFDTLLGEIG